MILTLYYIFYYMRVSIRSVFNKINNYLVLNPIITTKNRSYTTVSLVMTTIRDPENRKLAGKGVFISFKNKK